MFIRIYRRFSLFKLCSLETKLILLFFSVFLLKNCAYILIFYTQIEIFSNISILKVCQFIEEVFTPDACYLLIKIDISRIKLLKVCFYIACSKHVVFNYLSILSQVSNRSEDLNYAKIIRLTRLMVKLLVIHRTNEISELLTLS